MQLTFRTLVLFFLCVLPLLCEQPFFLLDSVQLFTPNPDARYAGIPIELLDWIEESLI